MVLYTNILDQLRRCVNWGSFEVVATQILLVTCKKVGLVGSMISCRMFRMNVNNKLARHLPILLHKDSYSGSKTILRTMRPRGHFSQRAKAQRNYLAGNLQKQKGFTQLYLFIY